MEISLQPDIYEPNIDNNGNYIDNIPSFTNHKNGIICPCGTRKDKTFLNKSAFNTHIKSITHKKWIISLNNNKKNYFIEYQKQLEIITNQQKTIQKLDNDYRVSLELIKQLNTELYNYKNNNHNTANLLDIDLN